MRVGVFGGAFNPPHAGHLVCAQEAHSALGLDLVVFVPVGEPPHRLLEADPGAEARLAMCDHALSADERFRLSRVEVEREGKSYTVDTLRSFAQRAPEDALVLILGADQACALPAWHEPAAVAELVAAIGVADRGDTRRDEVAARMGEVPGAAGKLEFFDMPRMDISSSLVRRRAAQRQPIRYLVPDKVASYIGAQTLYGASAPVGGAR
ncbi:MAG: nicotinate-nucleotide adenylyltransferase [Thermoleophilaceae bacterium]